MEFDFNWLFDALRQLRLAPDWSMCRMIPQLHLYCIGLSVRYFVLVMIIIIIRQSRALPYYSSIHSVTHKGIKHFPTCLNIINLCPLQINLTSCHEGVCKTVSVSFMGLDCNEI